MNKVYIRTFGCQMNDRDTELVYGLLMERGYAKADTLEEADVVLFNTCSVRKHAEDRVWGQVGMLKKLPRPAKKIVAPPRFACAKLNRGGTRPNKRIIGLVGCMAQRHKEKIFEKLPHVDFISGPANVFTIPALIEEVQSGGQHISALNSGKRPPREQPACRSNALSAYVSIGEGCDNFCSYCIVPYVRGREQSRPKKLILDEIKALADSGYKEVTLLGQNVNSYSSGQVVKGSSGRVKKNGFAELLEEVNKISGIERIRFVTSHPKDATEELFKAMRDLPKVCEHLHLPLQSGSNAILERMNRGYTWEKYLKLAEMYRKIVPGASLTTDIIVGFPGERENDFKQTYDAMKSIAFDSAFIFKYSPRAPAQSSKYEDDVPRDVKEKRNQLLLVLQKDISRQTHERLIGMHAEVLVESQDRKRSEGCVRGRTRTNKTVVFRGDLSLLKMLVEVRIKAVREYTLIGERDEN